MERLTGWIERHQLTAFFLLTFAITWGLGFSYGLVMRGALLVAPLAFVATCGPALAGIAVTAVIGTEPRNGARRPFWITFLVAWVAAALVFLAHGALIGRREISPGMVAFAAVGVLPVAFVIGMARSRIPEVRRLMASLIRLRGVWGWAVLGLLLGPVLILAAFAISGTAGRDVQAPWPSATTGPGIVGIVAVTFVYQLFFFNATGEEAGWRGFALPRLQARASPLVASLILGLLWVPWHLFLWRAEQKPVTAAHFWLEQYLVHVLFAVLIVWVYNRSGGSILAAGIVHASANTAFAFLSGVDFTILCAVLTGGALVLVVADRMWRPLPPSHAAVYCPPAHPVPAHGRAAGT